MNISGCLGFSVGFEECNRKKYRINTPTCRNNGTHFLWGYRNRQQSPNNCTSNWMRNCTFQWDVINVIRWLDCCDFLHGIAICAIIIHRSDKAMLDGVHAGFIGVLENLRNYWCRRRKKVALNCTAKRRTHSIERRKESKRDGKNFINSYFDMQFSPQQNACPAWLQSNVACTSEPPTPRTGCITMCISNNVFDISPHTAIWKWYITYAA